MTDTEIREELRLIDVNEDVTVDSWEADFIESIVYKYKGLLSEKQRRKAMKIIWKYES
jgi:hypothetical protein